MASQKNPDHSYTDGYFGAVRTLSMVTANNVGRYAGALLAE
jgi:hypothetical protein